MRRLLVDGYNVIRATPPYSEMVDRDAFESARAALVADVAAYAAGEFDATVVFDGRGNPHSVGEPHDVLGVTVIFSAYGTDADSVIEALARRYREAGDSVEVVTSDAQTQWAVMGGGVVRRSTPEFGSSLRSSEEEWREHSSGGKRGGRVEDRIDASVRDTLSRWAKGEP